MPAANFLPLPESIPAAVGKECNIYFANLLGEPLEDSARITVQCEKGHHLARRWTWTPKDNEAGEFPLTLRIERSFGGEIWHGATFIRVNSQQGITARYLAIGDSLTHRGIYTAGVRNYFASMGGSIELVGNQHAADDPLNRHEGYAGWKFADFLHPGSATVTTLPKVIWERPIAPDSPHSTAKASPDFITVFLGVNDIALLQEEELDVALEEILSNAGKLIQELHRWAPYANIGLIPPLAPAESQDAFGMSYGCAIPRWRYVMNRYRLLKELAKRSSSLAPKTSWISAFLNVDSLYGYPAKEHPINDHFPKLEMRHHDAVHPNESGFLQVADAIGAWMLEKSA